MILIDNRTLLKKLNSLLLNELVKYESVDDGSVIVEPSKSGVRTLKISNGDKIQYIHSKYDPLTEASRFIGQLENVDQFNHVVFVGVGLGYHITEFSKLYPTMKLSIYEPSLSILTEYLSVENSHDLPTANIQKIFSCTNENILKYEVHNLMDNLGSNILFVTLPVYENIYKEEIDVFLKLFKEVLKDQRNNLVTNIIYQQRWTINSIKNFPTVINTPNILRDVDKKLFQNKPAIIVAAGPSLSEEMENIRNIKENKLAYIFSVGSAINALIEHEIYPDAACTYDPSELNQKVIQIIKDRNIKTIPLVFGSSVGFETLEGYPGPMIHMITSQDTVSPIFIKEKNDIDIVLDAPSIAVVSFQLLTMLECNPVILAGQNLGYIDNNRYAEGIKYDHISSELSNDEIKNGMVIKDVYGNDILTDEGFNRMRNQLEIYIKSAPDTEVINTTNGGAHIGGTKFMRLSEVISDKLYEQVVEPSWYQTSNHYDLNYIKTQNDKMERYYTECGRSMKRLKRQLKEIKELLDRHVNNNIELTFAKFDKEFSKLKGNPFYQAFIEPILRVQNKRLSEQSQFIRYETNLHTKGTIVVEEFGKYLSACQNQIDSVKSIYDEFRQRLDQIITTKDKIGDHDGK